MPLPRDPQLYNDVRTIIDSALASGAGALLNFPSSAARVRFRQRFYTLRTLLRDRDPDDHTPYDSCVLRDGPTPTSLRLELTPNTPVEVIFDNPDAALVESSPLEPADPLLQQAKLLALKLGISR